MAGVFEMMEKRKRADARFHADCVNRFIAPRHLPFLCCKGWDRAGELVSLETIRKCWEKAGARESARIGAPLFQLYLHVPYCDKVCHFCNLNPVRLIQRKKLDQYVHNTLGLARFLSPSLSNIEFRSFFMGGGTPSILEESQMDEVLSRVLGLFRVSAGGERCIEVHPASFTPEKLDIACRHGFNKINLGVQTFDPVILAMENRGDQDGAAVSMISREIRRRPEIRFFNIDLILGLMGEAGSFVDSFKKAADLDPDTIRLYPLRPTRHDMSGAYGGHSTDFHARLNRLNALAEERLPAIGAAYGYRMERHHDCWYFRRGKQASSEWQVSYADRSEQPVSVLGLGPGARSHVAGEMSYVQAEGKDSKHLWNSVFMGYRRSIQDERFKFITSVLLSSQAVSMTEYQSYFGEDFEDVFKASLKRLIASKKARKKDAAIIFAERDISARIKDALSLFGAETVRRILDEYNYGGFRFCVNYKGESSYIWVEKFKGQRTCSFRTKRYGLIISGNRHPNSFEKSPAMGFLRSLFFKSAKRYPNFCADELTDVLYRALKIAAQSAGVLGNDSGLEIAAPQGPL